MHLSALYFLSGMASTYAAISPTLPVGPKVRFFQGMNSVLDMPGKPCKNVSDYEFEMHKMRQWSNRRQHRTFQVMKIFSTGDCDALNTAIPAAQRWGIKLWPVVWAYDWPKYTREKNALDVALMNNGYDWLEGVTVGSESLFRHELPPQDLAAHIWEIKYLVQKKYGALHVPVTTAETWSSWIDPSIAPVIQAVDIVMLNDFPYWEGARPEDPAGLLQILENGISLTYEATKKPIYIGETGWPTVGSVFKGAVPNLENAARYWKTVFCYFTRRKMTIFWFAIRDTPTRGDVESAFGISDLNYTLKYPLTC